MAKSGKAERHPVMKDVVAGTKRAMRGVFFFSVCINLLMLAVPLYMLQLFDRVVATRSTDTLFVLSLMVVFAILTMSVLEAVRGRLMIKLGNWLDMRLGSTLLESSIATANQAGEGAAQALRDLANVRNFAAGAGLFPVIDSVWVPVFLGIVYFMHPTLGLISIGGAVVLFGFAVANDVFTRKPSQMAGQASNASLEAADAAVRNADVVQAMGMRGAITAKWNVGNQEALDLQGEASRRTGSLSAAAKFVRLLVQVSILGTGAYLAMLQEISPGTMIAASIIMGRGLAPIEQSIQGWRGLVSARAAFGRLAALIEVSSHGPPPSAMPKPEGNLVVDQLTYVPSGSDQPVVKRVGFTLEPGEVLGLIGPTAAGKTTLARLLVGSLKPSLGTITLDGMELSAWDPENRGKYIGYLPQYVQLFGGTVRNNIARLGDGDDESVFAAAKLAGVHDLIVGLPNAYDTEIGPAGVRLSGGQRQSIALARAVYACPTFVVLDEPNSNLDRAGEQALIEALSRMKAAGMTVIVIAQHAAVLAGADKLLVLKDGAVAHFDQREKVLAELDVSEASS